MAPTKYLLFLGWKEKEMYRNVCSSSQAADRKKLKKVGLVLFY